MIISITIFITIIMCYTFFISTIMHISINIKMIIINSIFICNSILL